MDASLHQILTIWAWFLLSGIILFIVLIARFYEDVSKERTFYWLFVVPFFLFSGAAARYAYNNSLQADWLGDGLWAIGGLILALQCVYLYHLMTTGR